MERIGNSIKEILKAAGRTLKSKPETDRDRQARQVREAQKDYQATSSQGPILSPEEIRE